MCPGCAPTATDQRASGSSADGGASGQADHRARGRANDSASRCPDGRANDSAGRPTSRAASAGGT